MKRRLVINSIAGILIVSAIVLYYNVNPAESVMMPKCVLKQITGYDCPSCGVQRAFYALLHGEFIDALSYNFFFVISVPYFLLVLYYTIFKKNRKGRVGKIVLGRNAIFVYIVLYFAWWIVRNVFF